MPDIYCPSMSTLIEQEAVEPGDEMARKKGAVVQAFKGEKLRDIRDGKELTRRALSDLAGVTELTIYEVEQGRRAPTLETAAKLAAALGVGIEELFE